MTMQQTKLMMGLHILLLTNWILPAHCNVDDARTLHFGKPNNTLKMIFVLPFQTMKSPNIAINGFHDMRWHYK
jgi:hypothetical protein